MSYNKINCNICLVCIPTLNIFIFPVPIPWINCAVPSLKGLLKRGGVSLTFTLTLSRIIFLRVFGVCVFFSLFYTTSISIKVFVFHRKNLVS